MKIRILESFGLLNKDNEALIKNNVVYVPYILNMIQYIYRFFAASIGTSAKSGNTCFIVDAEFYEPSSNSYATFHRWWQTLAVDLATFVQEELVLINNTILKMPNMNCTDLVQQIAILNDVKNIDRYRKYIDTAPIKKTIASLQREIDRAKTDEDLSQLITRQHQLNEVLLKLYPEQAPTYSRTRYNFTSNLGPT